VTCGKKVDRPSKGGKCNGYFDNSRIYFIHHYLEKGCKSRKSQCSIGKIGIFVMLNYLSPVFQYKNGLIILLMQLLRIVVLIAVTCVCLSSNGQTRSLKLNASFTLGLRQVGGFAAEYSPDSSLISFGAALEFGNFDSRQIGTGNSQIDTRSVVGLGLSPHMRIYPFRNWKPAPHGFFIEGATRLRWARQTMVSGIVVNPLGYDLDDAIVVEKDGWILDFSFAAGYKTGKGKRNLEFEFLSGYGYTPQEQKGFYRLEVFICGIFNRKTALPEDFFW